MNPEHAELARRLDEETHLWDALSPDQRAAARAAVAAGTSPLDPQRDVPETLWCDGEWLAEEGGLPGFFEEYLTPAARRLGVDLSLEILGTPLDPDGELKYDVAINGRRLRIYGPASTYSPWLLCTVRPFAMVNQILAEHGARERLHTVDTGNNEARAYLIEPHVAELMALHGVTGRELPEAPETLLEFFELPLQG